MVGWAVSAAVVSARAVMGLAVSAMVMMRVAKAESVGVKNVMVGMVWLGG